MGRERGSDDLLPIEFGEVSRITGDEVDPADLADRPGDRVAGVAGEDVAPIANAVDLLARVAGGDEESHDPAIVTDSLLSARRQNRPHQPLGKIRLVLRGLFAHPDRLAIGIQVSNTLRTCSEMLLKPPSLIEREISVGIVIEELDQVATSHIDEMPLERYG